MAVKAITSGDKEDVADFGRSVRQGLIPGVGGYNHVINRGADVTPVPITAVFATPATWHELARVNIVGAGGQLRIDYQLFSTRSAGVSRNLIPATQYSTDGGSTWTTITAASDYGSVLPNSNMVIPFAWTDLLDSRKLVKYAIRMTAAYSAAPANGLNVYNPRIIVAGLIAEAV